MRCIRNGKVCVRMGENVNQRNGTDGSPVNNFYNPETNQCVDPCLVSTGPEAVCYDTDLTCEPVDEWAQLIDDSVWDCSSSAVLFGPQPKIPTKPQSEAERRFVTFKKTTPTVDNVHELLKTLADIYRLAEQQDPAVSRKCRITAAEYVKFALKNGVEKDTLRELVVPFGIHLPIVKSFTIQIGNVVSNYGPGRAAQKITAEVMEEEQHDSRFTDSPVSVSLGDWAIHNGLQGFDISIGTEAIGFLIRIKPDSGLNLGYTVEELSHEGAEQKGYRLFAAANYSVNETIPATVSIVNGEPSNLYVAPHMDGIVVIRNGKPEIFNADRTDIFKVMDETMAQGGTMFQSNLIVHNGTNTVPKDGSSYSADIRRILVTFNDGSYGIVQIDDYIDLYEAGQILTKIPNLVHAVNLDTGGSNVAGYQQEDGSYYHTGETEDYGFPVTSATIVYVK